MFGYVLNIIINKTLILTDALFFFALYSNSFYLSLLWLRLPIVFYDTFPQTLRRIIDNVITILQYLCMVRDSNSFFIFKILWNLLNFVTWFFCLLKQLWESVAGCPYSSSPHKVKFELCCVSYCYKSTRNNLLSLLYQISLFLWYLDDSKSFCIYWNYHQLPGILDCMAFL